MTCKIGENSRMVKCNSVVVKYKDGTMDTFMNGVDEFVYINPDSVKSIVISGSEQ
jgi:hypothetical protein